MNYHTSQFLCIISSFCIFLSIHACELKEQNTTALYNLNSLAEFPALSNQQQPMATNNSTNNAQTPYLIALQTRPKPWLITRTATRFEAPKINVPQPTTTSQQSQKPKKTYYYDVHNHDFTEYLPNKPNVILLPCNCPTKSFIYVGKRKLAEYKEQQAWNKALEPYSKELKELRAIKKNLSKCYALIKQFEKEQQEFIEQLEKEQQEFMEQLEQEFIEQLESEAVYEPENADHTYNNNFPSHKQLARQTHRNNVRSTPRESTKKNNRQDGILRYNARPLNYLPTKTPTSSRAELQEGQEEFNLHKRFYMSEQ